MDRIWLDTAAFGAYTASTAPDRRDDGAVQPTAALTVTGCRTVADY
jgi:hypothetical protein